MGMRFAEIQEVEGAGVVPVKLEKRVRALINSPVAQLGRRVRIHRLDTDGASEWGEVMDRLAATNGLQMDFEEAGSVILQWEKTEDFSVSFGPGTRLADQARKEAPF